MIITAILAFFVACLVIYAVFAMFLQVTGL